MHTFNNDSIEQFEPLPLDRCHLTRWVKRDRYQSILSEPFDSLHQRVHELSDIIVHHAAGSRPEQIGLYLHEFERASDALGRVLLECLERHIAAMATHDQLTRLLNRTTLEREFERNCALAARLGRNVGFILLDLDYFKRINDEHGHFAGDRVLVDFACLLSRFARSTDMVFRWGGEEFVILGMVEPGSKQSMLYLAERIRCATAETEFQLPAANLKLTVSGGVVEFPVSGQMTLQSVFSRADSLLYEAKQKGRNQIGYWTC